MFTEKVIVQYIFKVMIKELYEYNNAIESYILNQKIV